jgi:rhodanese-related sulfurtransferase
MDAKRRLAAGTAVLVDIREPMEHAREAIPGARSSPLSSYGAHSLQALQSENAPAVIFHCQSGKRTSDNAERLLTCGMPELYILEGGLTGWKSAGLATRVDRSRSEPVRSCSQDSHSPTLYLRGFWRCRLSSARAWCLPASRAGAAWQRSSA